MFKDLWFSKSLTNKIFYSIPFTLFGIVPPLMVFRSAGVKDLPELILSYLIGGVIYWYLYGKSDNFKWY